MPTFSRQQKIHDLDAHNARQLVRIARETGETLETRPVGGAMAGGDAQAMRGVPLQAKGVGGTARGTDPLTELLRRQPRDA